MRYENWPERLNKFISDNNKKPFTWGEHDCCLFAANAIREITGFDYAEELRGSYSTIKEAVVILNKIGGVKKLASSYLSEEINPMMAQRGDLVLIETDEHGETLAICIGDKCVAPGMTGLQFAKMSTALTAWRIN